jgi:Oxidoreductase FAD-binding domain
MAEEDAVVEILICQSSSCRKQGAEAVLLEIEELVMAVNSNCKVRDSGCLGLCNKAPAAAVLTTTTTTNTRRTTANDIVETNHVLTRRRNNVVFEERYFTNVETIKDSCRVVKAATGKCPDMTSDLQHRLLGVRAIRKRQHAVSTFRWNAALKATLLQGQIETSNNGIMSTKLRKTLQDLLAAAGYHESQLLSSSSSFMLSSFSTTTIRIPDMPIGDISNYSPWTLHAVTKVSRHSAVYHFRSDNVKRGTPHPRGGGRAMPSPKTWHTTLLAEVGSTNHDEGPLPWIERDYTPISTAKEWEQGKCDILIKIYMDGKATSWLHRISTTSSEPRLPRMVWLSKPLQTLNVPTLAPKGSAGADSAFYPVSCSCWAGLALWLCRRFCIIEIRCTRLALPHRDGINCTFRLT